MPIIELLTGHLSELATEKVYSLFRTNVIERWSKRRADHFVQSFCEVVLEGSNEDQITDLLDEIMSNEHKSAALFDAYRRVSLSASPQIGPRIIAMVTAGIVLDERGANTEEERLLSLAECMTDDEFAEAKDWFDRYVQKKSESVGGFLDAGEPESTASTSLWEGWGSWAVNLQQYGFIQLHVRMIANTPESYTEFETPYAPALATDMFYDGSYHELARLIGLATPVVE